MITVVIPYYQKSPGILTKALASIAAQQNCPLPLHVMVVDDASPAPTAPELASAGPMSCTVQVIRQPNAGPGAARNTGLDNAPRGARYIAFHVTDIVRCFNTALYLSTKLHLLRPRLFRTLK